MPKIRVLHAVLCLALAPLVGTCSSSTWARTAVSFLTRVSGNSQVAVAGQPLPQSLVVRVTSDEAGTVAPGVAVTWAVVTGGGHLSQTTDTTGADGLSTVAWTLGAITGQQTATATVAGATGSPVPFTATASALLPTQLTLVSGNGQSATVSATLAAPLVVKVGDASNAGVAGVTVSWTVTGGGGQVSAATSVTDASGQAQVTWTLGATVGAQTVAATVAGLTGSPLLFAATGTALPATQITLVSGNSQTGALSAPLAAPLVVKVANAANGGVAGVTVTWAVTGGGGQVSAATSVTNASGQAQITWTLGATVGAQTATASVTGLTGSPVTFTATGAANPPTQIALVSGNAQTGSVSTALPAPLVVKVSDASNAAVAGVTVNWAVTGGGGQVSAATSVSNASGQAQITWTLGATVGAQTATATVVGLTGSPVTFSATGTALPATQLSLVSGNSQSATVSTALSAPLVVKVANAANGGVAGVTVNWAVTAGGGQVSAATSVTNASGQAQITWTLGATVGAQTATATVTGLTGSPVTFGATGTAPPPVPTQIALVSGNGQTGTVNTALAAPLVVKVGDASNVGVSGVTVNWAVTAGGGAVAAATSLTNASGQAQIAWTLGSTVGAQSATATVNGLTGSPVTFSATGTASTRVQRFLSPTGSDAANGQTAGTAWRTFAKAFGAGGIGAGGELILLDGTYSVAAGTGYISWTGTNSAQPPSGTGRAATQQTWVHAQNPGNVTVVYGPLDGNATGSLFIGRSTRKDSNITVQGITFEGGGNLYNTSYVTVKDCGFHGSFGIGTNDHAQGNSYNLVEDVWVWGAQERIIAINYRGDHNVWRRVVVRGDGCNAASCVGSGNPNVGITVYESTFTEMQNIFVVDRILGGGEPYADFATAQHTSGQSHGGNRWRGSASINSEDQGLYFEWDLANTYPVADVADFVVWRPTSGWGLDISGRGGSEDMRLSNVTVAVDQNGDGVRIGPGTTGSVMRNLVVFGSGRYGINSAVQPSYADVYGSWSSVYNQTSCATGCRTTNPTADGATPSLQWPLRIESGSALSGTGAGGANYGATIVNRFGADGAHWGEAGYNTVTAAPLWPWPGQATIKTQMCNGVTRGWCGTSLTFTQYVWGLMGSGLPPGINPVAPSGARRRF
jgi:hypothetical protein